MRLVIRARLDKRRLRDRVGGPLTCSGRNNRLQGTLAWGLTKFRRTAGSISDHQGRSPEGTEAELNPWCEQTSGKQEEEETLGNPNDERTLRRESGGSPEWQSWAPSHCERDQGLTKKDKMGDRSVISTPESILGGLGARNVRNSAEERAVDGNALLPAMRWVASAGCGAPREKHQLVPGRVSYEDTHNMDNPKAGYEKPRAPGTDGKTIKANMTERGLAKPPHELKRQTHAPRPAKRILIPGRGNRPLSTASTVDKVV